MLLFLIRLYIHLFVPQDFHILPEDVEGWYLGHRSIMQINPIPALISPSRYLFAHFPIIYTLDYLAWASRGKRGQRVNTQLHPDSTGDQVNSRCLVL